MKKWKWIYKFIFSIMLVAVGLFMWPQKQVKALEQGYPTYLLKAEFYELYYERVNTNTREYRVEYVLTGIEIDTINDYFFNWIHYSAINKGLDRGINSYELEDIEIGFGYTLINVRFTFTNYWLNQNYGGYDYNTVLPLFEENSVFYVEFDVYNKGYYDGYDNGFNDGWNEGYDEGYAGGKMDGYNEGRDVGYSDGYELGRDEGYTNGYNDGYTKGADYGYEVGYNLGYDEGHYDGYDLGYLNGRDEGYNNGYIAGKEDGYNEGYDEGYSLGNSDGYEKGFDLGREQGYNEGYDEGYSKGYNIGMNIQHNKFSDLLNGVFTAIGTFLGIRLFPGITIGALLAVPIVFGIIAFILGRRRG